MNQSTAELHRLHIEYKDRFNAERERLIAHISFAKLVFANNEQLFSKPESNHAPTLATLFTCSLEAIALCLARLWEDDTRKNTISIPNLVNHFEPQRYFGCNCLQKGEPSREKYNKLFATSIKSELRILRTEVLAHNVQFGTSSHRPEKDIFIDRKFNLKNGAVVKYAIDTLNLLDAICSMSSFHECSLPLSEAKKKALGEHQRFLQKLSDSPLLSTTW